MVYYCIAMACIILLMCNLYPTDLEHIPKRPKPNPEGLQLKEFIDDNIVLNRRNVLSIRDRLNPSYEPPDKHTGLVIIKFKTYRIGRMLSARLSS